MSWSLFKITTIDTSGIETQLKRLADAAETRLRLEHNYHLTPPTPIASAEAKGEESVEYSDDEMTAMQELVSKFERLKRVAPEDTEAVD